MMCNTRRFIIMSAAGPSFTGRLHAASSSLSSSCSPASCCYFGCGHFPALMRGGGRLNRCVAVFVSGPETRDTCSDDYPPMCRPRPPCLCCRQSLPLGGFAHPCSLRDRANQSHPRFGGPRTDPPRSTIAPSCLGDGGGACYSRQACPILSCDCAEYFPSLFWPFSFSRAVF